MEFTDEVSALRAQVKALESKVKALEGGTKVGAREKIAEMSSEVVDSNPYSRLLALQRMVRQPCPPNIASASILNFLRSCLDSLARMMHGAP